MKSLTIKRFSIGFATLAFVAAAMIGVNSVKAAACFQYNPNGFTTSTTPVFNNICNITAPLSSTQGDYPLGDEPNFVRIRPNTSNGNPLGSANPALVNNLSSNCDDGSKFDVWTYIHNDASPEFNDNGNGSAVAHDVRLNTSAPINSTNNNFSFSSTVSASNAASVSDNATLTCNGQPVQITMVPGSVHYNNNLAQTSYGSLSDGVVNGSTPIGSPNFNQANVWGCWEFRTVVVYEVTVHKQTPPPPVQPKFTCDMLDVTQGENRKVTISKFNTTTAGGATFTSAVIDWGDNSTPLTSASPVGQTHQYRGNGPFLIKATAHFSVGDQDVSRTSGTCQKQVSFTTPPVTPPNTPPSTPPSTPGVTTQQPSALVNTGPGQVAGLFAAATVAGTAAYYWVTSRRLNRQ